jgi:hypothetical protein
MKMLIVLYIYQTVVLQKAYGTKHHKKYEMEESQVFLICEFLEALAIHTYQIKSGRSLMIKARGTFSLGMTQVLKVTSFTIQIPEKL